MRTQGKFDSHVWPAIPGAMCRQLPSAPRGIPDRHAPVKTRCPQCTQVCVWPGWACVAMLPNCRCYFFLWLFIPRPTSQKILLKILPLPAFRGPLPTRTRKQLRRASRPSRTMPLGLWPRRLLWPTRDGRHVCPRTALRRIPASARQVLSKLKTHGRKSLRKEHCCFPASA